MTDILTAIDAAIGCQQCGGTLGDSPSDDFCREACAGGWFAARAAPLAPHAAVGIEPLVAAVGPALAEVGRALNEFASALSKAICSMHVALVEAGLLPPVSPPVDVRERALHLRRTRNTGPPPRPLGRR